MKRLTLTDALIREALSPDPHTTAPSGLLAQISAEVAQAPQRRTLRLPQPQARRPAWVLLAAVMLLVLLGVLLVAGGSPNPFLALMPPAPSPAADTAEPTPEPSPTASPLAELRAYSGAGTRLLAVDGDQAWATRSGDGMRDWLWRRDVAGWTGPTTLENTSISTSTQGTIRGLAGLGDGRLAIATDTGLWVGSEEAWTQAWAGTAWDVAVAPDGRLWVAGSPPRGDSTLRAVRETAAGWEQDWSGCRSGGNAVAIAADGSVWTAGITYSSMGGVARVQDGACEDVHPLGEGRDDEVMGIAASPSGAVAVHVVDVPAGAMATGGRLLEWADGRWTEVRAGSDLIGLFHALAYTPDGALWTTFDGALSRYTDGEWQQMTTAMPQAPISAAPDGTVWYVRADQVIDRLRPSDLGTLPGVQHNVANPCCTDGYMAVVAPGVAEGPGLVAWHRTPDGWTGPYLVEQQKTGTGYPRSLVHLPDGRLAVSAQGGLWVGRESDWTRLRDADTGDVAVGTDGTLWFGTPEAPGLLSMREMPDGWQPGTGCEAGGSVVAAGPDGVTWSASDLWSTPATVVRVADGRCAEQSVLAGAAGQVLALAADTEGGVAAMVYTRDDRGNRMQVVHWDGRAWGILHDVAGGSDTARLAFGTDGTLWMLWGVALARYADGAWTTMANAANGVLATAQDGTIWIFESGGVYRSVDSLEAPNP